MYKKTITYTDFDGNKRTEDHYFNLMQSELLDMQTSVQGGFYSLLQKIIASQDQPALMKVFKEIIKKSYGIKSVDGRRFEKTEEIFAAFEQSPAYSELYMELVTNDKAAAEFINGIIPADLAERVAAEQAKGNIPAITATNVE